MTVGSCPLLYTFEYIVEVRDEINNRSRDSMYEWSECLSNNDRDVLAAKGRETKWLAESALAWF